MFIETDAKNRDYEERADPLFQPDALLAAQYFDTFRRKVQIQPERRLLIAVLEDAIFCFQKYISSRERRGETLFREAEDWIRDEDRDYIFSFQNICEALGLDASYVRTGLFRWKKIRPPKHPEIRAKKDLRRNVQISRTNRESKRRVNGSRWAGKSVKGFG
jgi:PAS domain-containing protein